MCDSLLGVSPNSVSNIDYNDGIVFKGVQIHGVNGRKIFDTWYRNGQTVFAAGRIDSNTSYYTHSSS
ncbi:MAG: hypothetical protein R2883_01940 [Caldisericia bacterium]